MTEIMKDGELKIHYKGELDTKLDAAIRKCLGKFGYGLWATGYNLETGVRDLAFDRQGRGGKK